MVIGTIGCHSPNQRDSFLQGIPVHTPTELLRFDQGSDYYLVHIGYTTVVLDDGSILLPDRQQGVIFKIDETGEFKEVVVTKGRGPGEVQDITFMSQSAFGKTLIYDQMTQKVVVLDRFGGYSDEFIVPSWGGRSSLTEIYELEEHRYLFKYSSYEYLFNEDREQVSYLVVYDKSLEEFVDSKTIRSRPYAVLTGGGGGHIVPYAPADLLAYNSNTANFHLFGSEDVEIVELSSLQDTVQLISLEIKPERLSTVERDTLRNQYPDYWDSMQLLLPEYKAIADRFIIDHENNFWLKLNYKSDSQQWLVVSESGELLRIIRLPKDARVTHVSGNHLGIRLDDGTFSFFEPIY